MRGGSFTVDVSTPGRGRGRSSSTPRERRSPAKVESAATAAAVAAEEEDERRAASSSSPKPNVGALHLQRKAAPFATRTSFCSCRPRCGAGNRSLSTKLTSTVPSVSLTRVIFASTQLLVDLQKPSTASCLTALRSAGSHSKMRCRTSCELSSAALLARAAGGSPSSWEHVPSSSSSL
eukprot:COSAG06_NODE_2655_length_6487_cov_123.824515_1_plen_178_part_00